MKVSCGVAGADQLQRTVERGEYAEAARLLEAVQQLAAHFAAFGAVPKVRAPENMRALLQATGVYCSAGALQPPCAPGEHWQERAGDT